MASSSSRAAVLEEIINTEEAYVRHLGTLLLVYSRPLLSAHLISKDDYDWIFQDLEVIMNINRAMLTEFLKYSEDDSTTTTASGDNATPAQPTFCQIFVKFVRSKRTIYYAVYQLVPTPYHMLLILMVF